MQPNQRTSGIGSGRRRNRGAAPSVCGSTGMDADGRSRMSGRRTCGPEGRMFESCWARQNFMRRLGGLTAGAFPLWVPRHGLHSQTAADLLVSGARVRRGTALEPRGWAGTNRLPNGPADRHKRVHQLQSVLSAPQSVPPLGSAVESLLAPGPSLGRVPGSDIDRLRPCSTKAARSAAEYRTARPPSGCDRCHHAPGGSDAAANIRWRGVAGAPRADVGV